MDKFIAELNAVEGVVMHKDSDAIVRLKNSVRHLEKFDSSCMHINPVQSLRAAGVEFSEEEESLLEDPDFRMAAVRVPGEFEPIWFVEDWATDDAMVVRESKFPAAALNLYRVTADRANAYVEQHGYPSFGAIGQPDFG